MILARSKDTRLVWKKIVLHTNPKLENVDSIYNSFKIIKQLKSYIKKQNMWDLYLYNWWQKLKKNLRNRGDIPCPWTQRVNIVKTKILPKLTYRFKVISIIIPTRFLLGMVVFEIDQPMLKLIWKCQRLGVFKAILRQKDFHIWVHDLLWGTAIQTAQDLLSTSSRRPFGVTMTPKPLSNYIGEEEQPLPQTNIQDGSEI